MSISSQAHYMLNLQFKSFALNLLYLGIPLKGKKKYSWQHVAKLLLTNIFAFQVLIKSFNFKELKEDRCNDVALMEERLIIFRGILGIQQIAATNY